MAFREVRVSTLSELLEQVTPQDPDPDSGRRRDSGVYRGCSDSGWPLLTSLDRLGGIHPPHRKAGLEEHLLRNFVRYSRPYLGHAGNEWELLVAAQHHGLPTRLLDWSYSPLIAAHFATIGPRDRGDRVVWRLDWKRMHCAFGLPELALLIQDLDRLFETDGGFTPWKLFSRQSEDKPFACMLEPPSLDVRIVSQSATFTLCSDKRQPFDRFLEEQGLGDILTRYVIPADAVDPLRDQLDLVGIDERRIFPDLEGVAAQMRRYYS